MPSERRVRDRRNGQSGAAELLRDPASPHDEAPVADVLYLGVVRRDHYHSHSSPGLAPERVIDRYTRPDVDARGRLGEQDELRLAQEGTGEDELLCVPSTECGRLGFRVRRPDVESP